MLYLVEFCSRPETANGVISNRFMGPIICDKPVKFRNPRLNRSRESPPATVRGGIFGRFSHVDNLRLEVASDVISGVVVGRRVWMDVHVKFRDSRSNRARVIRLSHFVTNERTTPAYAGHHIRPKRHAGVLPKKTGHVAVIRLEYAIAAALAIMPLGGCSYLL